MRDFFKAWAIALLAYVFIAGCTKDNSTLSTTQLKASNVAALATSNCTSPYLIILESITNVNGDYEWVWSIQNTSPGNGKDSTVQDLSHWNISLGTCLDFDDVIGAATSTDGINWTAFSPTYKQDKSIRNMNTGDVLKFDVGTNDTTKTYFKLIISEDLDIDMNGTSYYKSGKNTGAGMQCFPGPGCPAGDGDGDGDELPGERPREKELPSA